eukprot:SAG11_NODE_184_length_13162_cov_9.151803_5_plen_137_part_00
MDVLLQNLELHHRRLACDGERNTPPNKETSRDDTTSSSAMQLEAGSPGALARADNAGANRRVARDDLLTGADRDRHIHLLAELRGIGAALTERFRLCLLRDCLLLFNRVTAARTHPPHPHPTSTPLPMEGEAIRVH